MSTKKKTQKDTTQEATQQKQVSTSVGGAVKAKVKEPRLNLTRFLQVEHQNNLLVALLKKDYAMQAKTLQEWQQLVMQLLNKKIR